MSQSFSKRNAEKHIYSACSLFSFVRNLLDLVRIDLHVEVDLGWSLTFIEDVNIWTRYLVMNCMIAIRSRMKDNFAQMKT